MKVENFKKEKGFTLVETLIAISILMIAIASPINLAQKALSSAILSRDQMTASFLAQDGLEAIKNLRDEIAIRPDSLEWLSPFTRCMCTGNQCDDFDYLRIKSCNIDSTEVNLGGSIVDSSTNPDNANLKIKFNEENVFIKYDLDPAGDKSKFARLINITKTADPSGNEAVVKVRVCWPFPTCEQKVDIKGFIYNYSPYLI